MTDTSGIPLSILKRNGKYVGVKETPNISVISLSATTVSATTYLNVPVGGSIATTNLTDVSSTPASVNGQILVWNNEEEQYVPSSLSITTQATTNLTDVSSTPASIDGQLLIWDNTQSKYTPSSLSVITQETWDQYYHFTPSERSNLVEVTGAVFTGGISSIDVSSTTIKAISVSAIHFKATNTSSTNASAIHFNATNTSSTNVSSINLNATNTSSTNVSAITGKFTSLTGSNCSLDTIDVNTLLVGGTSTFSDSSLEIVATNGTFTFNISNGIIIGITES